MFRFWPGLYTQYTHLVYCSSRRLEISDRNKPSFYPYKVLFLTDVVYKELQISSLKTQ